MSSNVNTEDLNFINEEDSLMRTSHNLEKVLKGSITTKKEKSSFMIVVTKPDSDITWRESYIKDSWKDAYIKMVELILQYSDVDLDVDLINGKAVINPYSAQAFCDSIRYVYYIIPYVSE